jgi:hypothetical protein
MLVGALALMGDRTVTAARASGVWIVYPLSLDPGRQWTIAAWLVLGLIGAAVQLRAGTAPAKARRRKN